MKKALALVLSFVMVVCMAASAMADGAYDPASAGDYEFAFAWWGNQVRDQVTMDATKHFEEKYPNIHFNNNSQNWTNYWALMTTNAANNDLPDIMQQDYAYLEPWVEAGDLLDLTPYIESGALDVSNIPETILATGKVGDGIYAICAGMNAPATLYNKTLTDELGIEVPQNITWDEFVAISKQIYEAKGGYGVLYGDGNSENNPTYYVRSLGYNAFWDANGLTASVEEMTGYYQRLLDGVAEGWLFDTDKRAGVNVDDIAQHPLVYGTNPDSRTWCAIAFSNQISAFQAAATANGIELGVTSWPSSNPSASNYLKSSQFFSVTTDTKNPDLAVAFLNYMINDVEANTILRAERGVPASTVVAAAIADSVSAVDATYPLTVSYLAIVGDGNCSTIFPPLPGYAGQAQEEVIKYLAEELLTKGTSWTAEEAAQFAVDQIAEIASNY